MEPFTDQPRLNLGSLRQPGAPDFVGPPHTRWLRRSDKGCGLSLMLAPQAVVVGTCDADPWTDYHDLIDFQVQVLHPDTGELLHAVPDAWPLGLHADVLVCATGDSIQGRALRDGSLLWSARERGSLGLVTPGQLYLWEPEASPRRHPWPDPRRAPSGPEPLPVPAGRTGYLTACGDLLAVQTWWADPVRSRLDVLHDGAPVWEHVFGEDLEHDLIVDPAGWIFRTRSSTEAWDTDGTLRWLEEGMSRCWVSPRHVLGLRQDELHALSRQTGQGRALPGLRRPWDLAVAGDTVWAAFRPEGRLVGCAVTGERLWEGPQPDLGFYGIRRLVPYAGRLYAMGDDGSVACMQEP